MVSNSKRSRYLSGSSDEDLDYHPDMDAKPSRRPTRIPKCFTKNALMARENRLKKKMYVNSLEDQVASLNRENKRLTLTVESQANTIGNLKKEIKYLKSIINNSDGLGKLMKSININTGLPVTTSLDKKLALDTIEEAPKEADPLEYMEKAFPNIPTPESTSSYYSSNDFEQDLDSENFLKQIDLSLEMSDNDLFNIIDERALETPVVPMEQQVKSETSKDDSDVGVCLHLSNNKVSLEFCPHCSENSIRAWRQS